LTGATDQSSSDDPASANPGEADPAAGAVALTASVAVAGTLAATETGAAAGARWRDRYRDGVVATLPLLVGTVPFALVFGMSARAAGWSVPETQGLSMLLYAGGAQLAVLTLASGGATAISIFAVVALLNLRHVLYGMALARWLPPGEPPPRPLLATMLVDESFGLATREALAGRPSAAFLWGSGTTLYAVYAVCTLAGALLGERLPDPASLGLDFIFPLAFLALLLIIARGRRDWLVAGLSAILVVALGRLTDGGTALLAATIVAAALGALLGGPDRDESPTPTPNPNQTDATARPRSQTPTPAA
jgi:predicted branched-subunit amino acid permease